MSVRNYAILWPDRKSSGDSGSISGGNQLLSVGQHALDGAEHTGQLPETRLSTTETDTALVLHPDGSGGVVWDTDATGVGGGLPWFNVMDYGAVRDSSTDDATAINLAIADYNSAGGGVLYFPGGTGYYKCTAALTALTAPGQVVGDGSTGAYDGASLTTSEIVCTSGTATFLTIPAGVTVRGLGLRNTAGSVTAGYGIGGTDMNLCKIEDVSVIGFWINYDMDGGLWSLKNCYGRQAHKYSVDISYAASPDGGDWTMTDCYIVDGANSSDAGIHMVSGGGGKIVNLKINSNSSGMTRGFDMQIPNGVSTGDLLIVNASIEGIRGDAVRLQTAAGGTFHSIQISNLQVGFDQSYNSTSDAVSVVANTAGDLTGVTITNLEVGTFSGGAITGAAVKLTKADKVLIANVLSPIATLISQSGSTNIIDYTGGIAGGVYITGTPTSGQVPIASSGTAAAWGAPASGSVATDAIWDAAGDLAVGTGANTAAKLVKGNAGAVLAMGNSAVIWNAGTSLPASKATGDRYYRTDLGVEAFWDGSDWVTTELFSDEFGVGNTLAPATIATAIGRLPGWGTSFDLKLSAWSIATYPATTNDGTKFWTVSLNRFIANDTGTVLDSFTTAADTVNNWTQRRRALAVTYSASTNRGLSVTTGLTSTPGALYFTAIRLEYRLILT